MPFRSQLKIRFGDIDHAGIAFVTHIPEGNAGFGKQVGNRHHGRPEKPNTGS